MTRRVLVIDDEVDIRNALVTELKNAGYDTEELETGEHSVEMAVEYQPDAIVLDLMMPKVSGYEALIDLKANSKTARIPVIVRPSSVVTK